MNVMYGGTKTEMERLLKDAEKFSGIKYDISNLADVYNAIHVIQQEMGITGTTAKEANETISGSIGQLQGAWTNLVTAFADKQADIPARINDVVETAETAFGNLMPVVEQSITGIASFVDNVAPIVAEKLPGMVDDLIPPVLDVANTVVNSLVTALPSMLDSVAEIAPKVITDLSESVIKQAPKLAAVGKDLVISFAHGISESIPTLVPAAVDAVSEIAETLTEPDSLAEIVNAGLELVTGLATGIGDSIPELTSTLFTVAGNIYEYITGPEFMPKMLDAGVEIVISLGAGILSAIPNAIGSIVETLDAMVNRANDPEWNDKWGNAGTAMVDSLSQSFTNASEKFLGSVEGMLEKVDSAFNTHLAEWYKQYEQFAFDLGSWAWETNYNLYGGKEIDAENERAQRAHDMKTDIIYTFNEYVREGEAAAEAIEKAIQETVLGIKDYNIYEDYLKDYFDADWAQEQAKAVRIGMLDYAQATSIPTEALRGMNNANKQELDTMVQQVEQAGSAIEETPLFNKNIGEYRDLGIVKIMGQALDDTEKAADSLAKEVWNASKGYVERQTKALSLSLDEQIGMWQSVQAQFVEGSEQYLAAEDKILDLRQDKLKAQAKAEEDAAKATEKALKEQQKAEEKAAKAEEKAYNERLKALQKYQSEVDKIWDSIDKIEKTYTDALDDRTKDIYNSFGLFEKVPERILYSGVDLINNLQGQVDTLEKFYGDLATLSSRGVSERVIEEIQGMGVKAADQVDALLDLSDDKLKEWSDLADKKYSFAGETAEGQLAGLKADTEQQISDKLTELQALNDEKAEKYGESWAESFAKGMENGFEKIKDAAEKMLDPIKLFGNASTLSQLGGYIATAEIPETSGNNSKNDTVKKLTKESESIVININGIQFADMSELTRAIGEEMQYQLDRRNAYAGA